MVGIQQRGRTVEGIKSVLVMSRVKRMTRYGRQRELVCFLVSVERCLYRGTPSSSRENETHVDSATSFKYEVPGS